MRYLLLLLLLVPLKVNAQDKVLTLPVTPINSPNNLLPSARIEIDGQEFLLPPDIYRMLGQGPVPQPIQFMVVNPVTCTTTKLYYNRMNTTLWGNDGGGGLGCAQINTGGGGGIGGSGTTNTIPKFTANTTIGNSSVTDNATQVTTTEPFQALSVATGSTPPALTVGTGGAFALGEGTAATAIASADVCYGDSTAHAIKCSWNNGTFFNLPQVIANGTAAMGTVAIASGACAAAVTVGATGVATTDVISATFNADPTAVTGYIPSANGMLTIIPYPTANNVNFKVCNNTNASVTPGAVTLNWYVHR